ncbi:MAG: hypothetical protein PHE78_03545 [Candidatus Gastranaerophilales bacterium]|nr:hypothetical protein [Candidatus Gastranaerophilales bacterium]
MNKNFKIIQISGFSGLLIVGFVLFCLFCGFIGFPIWFLTNSWNYLVAGVFGGPAMNILQGSLLWSIVCLSVYICARDTFSIKIAADEEVMQDPEMLKMITEASEKDLKEKEEIKK